MENVKQETIKMEEMRKQPSKSEVIGSFIGMGMVGFCFGIGLMLAVKTEQSRVLYEQKMLIKWQKKIK